MDWTGTLRALFVGPTTGGPMEPREQAELVAGAGIEGDRYCVPAWLRAGARRSGEDVTLVEEEAIEALARDHGIRLAPGQTRRNLVTAGVPLNHLVGAELCVGPVVLRGVELAEPCAHLERMTGVAGLRRGLFHRGGLRADVVGGGVVRVGDPIRPRGPGPAVEGGR
ncbi:MAG: MOSC domain-containing protein [Actinobacteria bacterium]|nr:MOSC domain-containing protein [Actinomycetota bacterium]